MAEMIYTEINLNEIKKNTAQVLNKKFKPSDLVESIKRDGIKYPLVIQCNNKINKGCFEVGNQRYLIALLLGLEKIPAILYSIHHKIGFEGIPITDADDLIEIFGESVKNDPAYTSVSNTIRKIRQNNNYPPDPLKIQVQSDD